MTDVEKLTALLPDPLPLLPQRAPGRIAEVERRAGRPLPPSYRRLYERYDGDGGSGSFFGHSLLGLEDVLRLLDNIPDPDRKDAGPVPDPARAAAAARDLDAALRAHLPTRPGSWHHVVLEVSSNSLSGPYLYPRADTPDGQRQLPELPWETELRLMEIAGELQQAEKPDWEWDDLRLTVFPDRPPQLERSTLAPPSASSFTSTPQHHVRPRHYHRAWVPIIGDGGGNYVGLDLDPDRKGRPGQVILFGRDEFDLAVLAPDWPAFLDFNLHLLRTQPEQLRAEGHLHDYYRQLLAN